MVFPDSELERFYEIEGRAEFEDQEVTRDKWRWWYLYWHPEMRDKFWISPETGQENRMIINVYPEKASILSKEEVKTISKPYDSIVPE